MPGRVDIYGLTGILIAHVFYNMPLAVRLLLGGWAGIPGDSWRLASQLGMRGGQVFRLIEWPMIREVAPGIFGIIFLLCFTSFAIVLALGGGPPNATLEVAIYQALRLDFDLREAVSLAALQIVLCAAVFALATAFSRPVPVDMDLAKPPYRADANTRGARIIDTTAIALAALFVLTPLAALVIAGLSGPVGAVLTSAEVWAATARSLIVGLAAGALSCLFAGGLIARLRRAHANERGTSILVETVGSIVLVVPPLALGAGLFILLRGVVNPFDFALPIVAVVNALMGMPFALRILGPPARQVTARHGRLITGLGMRLGARLRLVDWPLLRRPLALALGLTTALSFGDLGVIALVGSQESATLPLLIYQRMGAYRMDEAAVIGLWLIVLALAVFFAIDRGVGGRDRT
jgi:thiamine transport system permease protein